MNTLLVTMFIVVAQPAFAGGMSEWSIERVNDDLSACNPGTQKGISQLRSKYSDIHFECAGGYLQKLLAPPSSDIFAQDPEVFVKRNWRLFLPAAPKKPLDLRHQREFDSKGQTTATQFYGGIEIWGAVAFWRSPVRRFISKAVEEKDYGMLHVHLLDSSDWKLRTDKVLSPEKAEAAVREFDKSNSIQAERYQAEGVPYIIESFCKGGPAMVIRVDAWGYTGEGKQRRSDLRIVPVNVETGKACSWN